MAEKSGFFNSVNGDRKYGADFFAEFFSSFIGTGIFPNPSTNLQVIANNDMTVTVKQGLGWINGRYYNNDSDLVLNIDVADGVLNRIDRVVLQYSTVNREIKAIVKKGTFASSPVSPVLQRDADAYELGIADISINNGAISISQANITDLRLDNTKCGIVHGTVEQVDTTTIFNQYLDWYTQTTGQAETDISNIKTQLESDFNTWFTGIQSILDGDTSGNLLNLINQNSAEIGDLSLIPETDLVSAIQADRSSLAEKATKIEVGTLTTLSTTEKSNLVGAINELFTNANNGKQNWVDVIGSPLLNTDTFATLMSKTQTLKNNMATNLTNKGQSSVGTEGLDNLISKIANINTGKKWASGTSTSSSSLYFEYAGTTALYNSPYIEVSGLDFEPSMIIAMTYVSAGSVAHLMIYNSIFTDGVYSKTAKTISGIFSTYNTSTITRNFKADKQSAYVNSTGFLLPVSHNLTYEWLAIE